MKPKKSAFRIVPAFTEKLGPCWSLKQGDNVVGTFISKQLAEAQKVKLENLNSDDFRLIKSKSLDIKF
jgi:hypothetical protein